MALDSVLFEEFKVIIWLDQTSTFGWVITMVIVSSGICCHGYHGNTIDPVLLIHKSSQFLKILIINLLLVSTEHAAMKFPV